MRYDCIIIGGGIAGLTCGIKCALEGLTCAVFSAGMSALHFSSGSIDVLGRDENGRVVKNPWEALAGFATRRREHPYHRLGAGPVREALDFFQDQMGRCGLRLNHNGELNHFHISALGTLKPTWLSQDSVFNNDIKAVFEGNADIAVLGFTGFRDFYASLAAANLKRSPLFKGRNIRVGSIDLPEAGRPANNPLEFRSIDVARMFGSLEVVEGVAARIDELAGSARAVGLPAVIGIGDSGQALKLLHKLTGRVIYEAPTLPPSILGMRLDDALKSRFAELGGVYIAGDRVIGGETANGRLEHIHTGNYGSDRLTADGFVMATGSFFSGGLASEYDRMEEPALGLKIKYRRAREDWSARRFFSPDGHGFLRFGLETDERFRPWDRRGRLLKNVFCAGAVLADYDPINEGSGAGVAIGTGYRAALEITGMAGGAGA